MEHAAFTNQNGVYHHCGIDIITDVRMVVDGDPIEVKRSWKDRLFETPFRPFKATETIIPKIPSTEILVMKDNKTMVMHPHTMDVFLEQVNKKISAPRDSV